LNSFNTLTGKICEAHFKLCFTSIKNYMICMVQYLQRFWKNKMTFSAVAIANYFIEKGLAEDNPVTPMKVQKLVYLSHGWFLALSKGQPLIKEKIGAWPFGPVIATLYKKFAKYSKKPITELAKDSNGEVIRIDPRQSEVIALLDKIWSVYGSMTAIQLSNLTHETGTPWSQVYEEGASKIIPDTIIQQHFDALGSNND
jgi:uncharacterized phage-associated protein